MTRAEIRRVQERLAALGFDPGQIDGVMGPHTESAIIAFKRSRGLKATAYVGPITMRALFTGSTEKTARPDSLPWMAEARKVLGLHEVRDNSRLRKWLGSDGHALGDPAKLPWCFPGDTEILTEAGWERLDGITASRVFQVAEDGALSLTEFAPVETEFHGELDAIEHRSFNLACSPNHRWWGCWGTVGRRRARKPNEFKVLADIGGKGLAVPAPKSRASGVGFTAEQLTFLAAYLSDGTLRTREGARPKIIFEVSKPRKIEALRALEPGHEYTQGRAYGPLTQKPLTVFTFDVPEWMSDAVYGKELRQEFVNALSADEALTFLEAYRVFDGTDRRFHLYTSSPVRRDALLQIALFAGLYAGVTVKQSSLSSKDCFEIHIGAPGTPRHIKSKNVQKREFSGTLYCVTVPQSRIVVREPGRGAIVTGNCGDFVETAIRLALPDEPIPQNPYWALNWKDQFGIPSALTYGCIAAIPRNGGGHVGFPVGQDASRIFLLGGNQSNTASIVPVDKSRFTPDSFRWPATYPARPIHMPYMTSAAAANTAES